MVSTLAPEARSTPGTPADESSSSPVERAGSVALPMLLVGLAWLAVALMFLFVVYPNGADGGAYLHRDDGIITLSHARGLVDVGSVSVGANGARVEGFSAPLQFALAVGYFAVGGRDAATFMDVQVALSTIVLGAAIFLFGVAAVPEASRRRQVVAASVLAVPAFASYRFFAWHWSGMENSLTNALFALTLALLALGMRRRQCLVIASLVAGLAAVSRVDMVVHLLPLVVITALVVAHKGGKRADLVHVLVPAATIWIVVQAARFWYFGALVPNSGAAQRIDPLRDVGAHLGGVVPTLSVLGALPWIFIILAAVVTARPRWRDSDWLLAVSVVTGALHVAVFGPARLSGERVASFVLVPLCCTALSVVLRFDFARLGARGAISPRVVALAVTMVLFASLAVVARSDAYAVTVLCCDTSSATTRAARVASDVGASNNLRVMTIAAPDLGALSLSKRFDIVDLGWLGDPLLTDLWDSGVDGSASSNVVEYLNEVARPDVVEIHGSWACRYEPWLHSQRFEDLYRQVWDDETTSQWTAADCPTGKPLRGGIWVRQDLVGADTTGEIALASALDGPHAREALRDALEACAPGDGRWRCEWVRRAVSRNLRTLTTRGDLPFVIDELASAPSAAFDRAMLAARRDGQWHTTAYDAFLANR